MSFFFGMNLPVALKKFVWIVMQIVKHAQAHLRHIVHHALKLDLVCIYQYQADLVYKLAQQVNIKICLWPNM